MITPQPRKRPGGSYTRFAADQPNERWQSDFTHWSLADGRDVEILNGLDDHSRYLLGCTGHDQATTYWRNTQKSPADGRALRHLHATHVSRLITLRS